MAYGSSDVRYRCQSSNLGIDCQFSFQILSIIIIRHILQSKLLDIAFSECKHRLILCHCVLLIRLQVYDTI